MIEIVNMPDGKQEEQEEKNRVFLKYLADADNFRRFIAVFPFILTTNLSANKLGPAEPFFDYVIIDEAGQCNIATSLIPMVRGKRLVLFGDPSQLRPVIVLDEEMNRKLREKYQIGDAYDYVKNSIIEVLQKKDRRRIFCYGIIIVAGRKSQFQQPSLLREQAEDPNGGFTTNLSFMM